jgi:hypothetical protein
MNKKIFLIALATTISLNHFIANSMEPALTKNTQKEVNKDLKAILAKTIAIKFKHALLNHNFQERKSRKHYGPLQTTSLGIQEEKKFTRHDGTYDMVPNIGYDYAMWDIASITKIVQQKALTKKGSDKIEKYIQLLHGTREEKPNFELCCAKEQYVANNKKKLTFIFADDTMQTCSLQSKMLQCALSQDHQWCALTYLDECKGSIDLFSLDSRTVPYAFKFQHPISALCSAHKSTLFAVCTTKGDLAFITLSSTSPICHSETTDILTHAEFSPDDNYLIAYGEKTLRFWKLKSIPPTKYTLVETDHPIRKAIFTPNGKLIVIALANGEFLFCDGTTAGTLEYYPATWRVKNMISVDNQAPLLLYSIKNKLLLSLDPAHRTDSDSDVYTFVVRKLTNGRILTAHNFYSNNPRAMGLTEDERSVVFTHHDDSVSLLHLYNDQDFQDTAFIEEKADERQLLEMFKFCQLYKTKQKYLKNLNATPLVTAIRDYIRAIAPANLISQ